MKRFQRIEQKESWLELYLIRIKIKTLLHPEINFMVPELFMNAKHYFVLTLVSLSPDHSVELFQLFIKIINDHGTIILAFVHKNKCKGTIFNVNVFYHCLTLLSSVCLCGNCNV